VVQDQGEKVTVSPTQSRCDWNSIDWASAVAFVRNLRREIFRATKEGDLEKVRTLQRIMLRTYENRVMAVRQVTQTNRGKNTPGVDKVVINVQLVHLFCHQAEHHGKRKEAKDDS
jgi:RNA-directed DNA polymerase